MGSFSLVYMFNIDFAITVMIYFELNWFQICFSKIRHCPEITEISLHVT